MPRSQLCKSRTFLLPQRKSLLSRQDLQVLFPQPWTIRNRLLSLWMPVLDTSHKCYNAWFLCLPSLPLDSVCKPYPCCGVCQRCILMAEYCTIVWVMHILLSLHQPVDIQVVSAFSLREYRCICAGFHCVNTTSIVLGL